MTARIGIVLLMALVAAPAMAQWSAGVDLMALSRDVDDRVTTVASYTREPLLSTSDASPDLGPGWRLRATRGLGDRGSLGVRLMGADGSGSASVTSDDNRLDPIFGWRGELRTNDFDLAWRHELRLDESLRCVEVDYARAIGTHWSWSAGLAALSFDQELELVSTDEAPSDGTSDVGRYGIATDNDLIGPTAGVQGHWTLGYATHLDLESSAGVLHSASRERTTLINDGVVEVDSVADDSGSSIVAQVAFRASWNVAPHLELGVSCEALWLEGVARAERQVASESSSAAFTALDSDGEALYSGVGFTITWRQ